MPFLSAAQSRFMHTPAGTRAIGGSAKLREWEGATDYSKLPERVGKKNTMGMRKPPKITK